MEENIQNEMLNNNDDENREKNKNFFVYITKIASEKNNLKISYTLISHYKIDESKNPNLKIATASCEFRESKLKLSKN